MTIEETFFNSVAEGDEETIEAIKAKAAAGGSGLDNPVQPDGGAVPETEENKEEVAKKPLTVITK